ncbi:MAG: hypothetical protein OEY77_00080 [Nitrospira sp.]|nr:hypothetical protein [Nitrospira sp.]
MQLYSVRFVGIMTALLVLWSVTAFAAPWELPMLPQGKHLGMLETFERHPAPPLTPGMNPQQLAAVDAARQQALNKGMKISRIQIDWNDLEPSPTTYTIERFVGMMGEIPSDHAILILLDGTAPEHRPSDLRTLPPNHWSVINRYQIVLQQMLPVMAGRNVVAFSVGNEPDNVFDGLDWQSTDGRAWTQQLVEFLYSVRPTLQSAYPNMAVGMTLTQISLERGRRGAITPIINQGDVAIFNYYCLGNDFRVQGTNVMSAEIDAMVSAAMSRFVILQEVGCPAGNTPSLVGATQSNQTAFYTELVNQIAARPQIRMAFAFQLIDWSPELSSWIVQELRDEGHEELANQFAEVWGTIGMLRWTDGSARPAWQVFLNGITQLRGGQPPAEEPKCRKRWRGNCVKWRR